MNKVQCTNPPYSTLLATAYSISYMTTSARRGRRARSTRCVHNHTPRRRRARPRPPCITPNSLDGALVTSNCAATRPRPAEARDLHEFRAEAELRHRGKHDQPRRASDEASSGPWRMQAAHPSRNGMRTGMRTGKPCRAAGTAAPRQVSRADPPRRGALSTAHRPLLLAVPLLYHLPPVSRERGHLHAHQPSNLLSKQVDVDLRNLALRD